MIAGKPLKLQYQSLSELVTENLMDFIMDGKIHMGEKLNTEELAQQLGVSRMPVRDAIKSLEKMGLVTSTPYVGSHVVSLDENDVREIYIGRKALEPVTAYHACEQMTGEGLMEVEDIHRKLSSVCTDEPLSAKRIFLYNKEFHFAIYRASGFKRIIDMIEGLWNNLAFCKLIYSQNYANNYDSAQNMLREHETFLEALRKKNPQLLHDRLYESLNRNERIIPQKVTEMLESRGK